MLLAIDIGNTNISFGIFEGKKLKKRFCIPTKYHTAKDLKILLKGCKIYDTILCSVVPKASKFLENDINNILGKRPKLIGRDIIVPIKNRYRNPKQVGQDRLVNAYAGIILYGAPLIAVDFGTAITFDVISRDKEYLGGMILPGIQISLNALAQDTALLPKIKLGKPKEFIGKDTSSSMLSGVVYGFSALTSQLVRLLKQKIGKDALIIGTGGDIGLIKQYCKEFDVVDRELTLKGLNLLYSRKSCSRKRFLL